MSPSRKAPFLLLLSCLITQVICSPFTENMHHNKYSASAIVSLISQSDVKNNNTNVNPSAGPLSTWENFVQPIPQSRQVLRGRIFIDRPIRRLSLHYTIDGGMATAFSRLPPRGDARLRREENPFIYRTPGCYFMIRSKEIGGRPIMTYGMLVDVFKALEELLEKNDRSFDTSFVLTDDQRISWGHGEISSTAPSS